MTPQITLESYDRLFQSGLENMFVNCNNKLDAAMKQICDVFDLFFARKFHLVSGSPEAFSGGRCTRSRCWRFADWSGYRSASLVAFYRSLFAGGVMWIGPCTFYQTNKRHKFFIQLSNFILQAANGNFGKRSYN